MIGSRLRYGARALLVLAVVALLGWSPAPASAATTTGGSAAERALAARYAPVVMLVRQSEPCGHGEPYRPSDVDALFDNPDVALRGPWDRDDLIKVGPSATDLGAGLAGYHLDFPGNPLKPGCDYEKWADATFAGTPPTIYAHVASEAGAPGRLALEYWFYYPFNDYNNKHESDWEMIQLIFPASTAAAALATEPTAVGYSQHEGTETAGWHDDKLTIDDHTHPVVYVAAGSHANYYGSALYLGRSGQQGFGCDNTLGPSDVLHPDVQVIPQDATAARAAYPWIGYQGRWGQREASFYNAPTGPSTKGGWSSPITAQQQRGHDRAFAVPLGGLIGTGATDFFCRGVSDGSNLLRTLVNHPGPPLIAFAVLVLVGVWLVRRTTWRPAEPLRLARRRAGGQALRGAARMYLSRPGLFVGIGLLTIPAGLLAAVLQEVLVNGPAAGIEETGESDGTRVLLAGVISLLLVGYAIVCVLAATTQALVDIDAGRDATVASAYRGALRRWRPLLGAFVVSSILVGILGVSVILSIVAVVLAVTFAFYVQTILVEGCSAMPGLRRSVALVRRKPLKVAVLLATSVLVVAACGPVLGTLVILGTGAPFPVANAIAGVAFALLVPYVGMTMTYAYFDARVHERLAATEPPPTTVLPAELI